MSDFVVQPGKPITATLIAGQVNTLSGGVQFTGAGSASITQTTKADGTPLTELVFVGETLSFNTPAGYTGSLSIDSSKSSLSRAVGGADSISLGLGADTILSGRGADILNAGGGADTVNPGLDRDTVTLGAGKDTLIVGADVGALTKRTIDNVTDFSHADDTIRLGKSLLKGSKFKAGVLNKSSFSSVKNIRDVGANRKSLLVYEQKTGIVYFDPIKGKDQPLVQLQKNQKNVAANDFQIF